MIVAAYTLSSCRVATSSLTYSLVELMSIRIPSILRTWSICPLGVLLILIGMAISATAVSADEAPIVASGAETVVESATNTEFVRIRRDDQAVAQALETAVVRYVPADGQSGLYVDLVGAVHIADRAYYERLNEAFRSYDVVLYELVAPEGTRIPKGGLDRQDRHPISQLQGGMKELLDLEHQLSVIDYTRQNFVHADMSPEEFAQSMKDRGESFTQMLLKMTFEGMAQQRQKESQTERSSMVDLVLSLTSKKKASQVQQSLARQWRNVLTGKGLEINEDNAGQLSDLEMMLAMFSNNRAARLKRVMAEQMTTLGAGAASLDGPDGSTIVTERNKKAIDVLRRQLDEGKQRIAIFYGAAHLPDMEKRLLTEFGLKRSDTEWLTAWDLSKN